MMISILKFGRLSISLVVACLVYAVPSFSQSDFRLQKYEEVYSSYKEKSIVDRRFKHRQIEDLLLSLNGEPGFTILEAGKSVEGRSIYHVKWGEGPIKILMWTQMHGDEPTATMAIMDLFNFLKDQGEKDPWLMNMNKAITLHCLPLLNPDGAERYQRHTALGIDMNRDALNLVQPESRILKALRDETNADWGFNLHDQSRYYSAGNSDRSARFSFLAPAFNENKDISEKREDAMQLIALMNAYLQKRMPGHVGKFSDSFEPRAFGDNIQAWGTRTILIESGGTRNDREKQDNRKTQFLLYLLAMNAIADNSFEDYSREQYRSIPFNDRRMYDLIVKNARINQFGRSYKIDLGINKHEINKSASTDYRFEAKVEEIGDLRTKTAYHIFDATGYELVFPDRLLYVSDRSKYRDENWMRENLKDGIALYCGVEPDSSFLMPMRWLPDCSDQIQKPIVLGANPILFFVKDGMRTHVLINGKIHKI